MNGVDARTADRIAAELEELILMRDYDDGARLDEARLAARFGVSRTPVREALHMLEATGLVEHRPRRGAFVLIPGPVELMELFEYMAELEASCGRLATRRMAEEGLAEIAAANAACEAATVPAEYYPANEVFHRLIYAQCGNRALRDAALRLQKRLGPYRRMQLNLRGRMAQSLAEHRAVLAALKAGEADRVAELLRAHVAVQGERFHRLLSQIRRPGEADAAEARR